MGLFNPLFAGTPPGITRASRMLGSGNQQARSLNVMQPTIRTWVFGVKYQVLIDLILSLGVVEIFIRDSS